MHYFVALTARSSLNDTHTHSLSLTLSLSLSLSLSVAIIHTTLQVFQAEPSVHKELMKFIAGRPTLQCPWAEVRETMSYVCSTASSSILPILSVRHWQLLRWETSAILTAVDSCICSRQHTAFLCHSNLAFLFVIC